MKPRNTIAATASRWITRLLVCLLIASAWPAHAASITLEQQRSLYREAIAALRAGNRQPLLRSRALLADYPLYPYLELEDLRRRLATLPTDEVDRFLQRHGDELPALRLRNAWLDALEKRGRWTEFLRYYAADDAALPRRCSHAWALLQTGNTADGDLAMAKLWATPRSLPEQCDAPLAAWMKRGNPTPAQAWQRFEAALLGGQNTFARYLQRFLAAQDQADAALFLKIAANPSLLSATQRPAPVTTRQLRMTDFALSRLASRDVRSARAAFERTLHAPGADASLLRNSAARIAHALAADSATEATRWIIALDAEARSETLGEDAVRFALRGSDWDDVLAALDVLPAPLADAQPWQYWSARAGSIRGDARAEARWASLARTRGWYGFLAADHLQLPYAMQEQQDAPSESLLNETAALPGLARSREFAHIGATLESRREWLHTIRHLDAGRQVAAAHLAARWDWPQLAIMTLANAQAWDLLGLRFPVTNREAFAIASRREQLDTSWLYAIARQESAFHASARSPAGALGLMQVMPATARLTARQGGIPYQGSNDLLDPTRNIRIGSRYMRMMLDRFAQNRILAAAAYNAGPGRIGQWLRRHPGDVESDRFVETIPFRETRQYVQNVLSFAVIYAYLDQRQAALLQPHERLIHNPQAVTGN